MLTRRGLLRSFGIVLGSLGIPVGVAAALPLRTEAAILDLKFHKYLSPEVGWKGYWYREAAIPSSSFLGREIVTFESSDGRKFVPQKFKVCRQ